MTPEEKATELVRKLAMRIDTPSFVDTSNWIDGKACAIICCDEIMASYLQTLKDKYLYPHQPSIDLSAKDSIRYWQQVKIHIQSL